MCSVTNGQTCRHPTLYSTIESPKSYPLYPVWQHQPFLYLQWYFSLAREMSGLRQRFRQSQFRVLSLDCLFLSSSIDCLLGTRLPTILVLHLLRYPNGGWVIGSEKRTVTSCSKSKPFLFSSGPADADIYQIAQDIWALAEDWYVPLHFFIFVTHVSL